MDDRSYSLGMGGESIGWLRYSPREVGKQLNLTNQFYIATDSDVRAANRPKLTEAWDKIWNDWRAFYKSFDGSGPVSRIRRHLDSAYERAEIFQARGENFRKTIMKVGSPVTPSKVILDKHSKTIQPSKNINVNPSFSPSFSPKVNVDFNWTGFLIVAGVVVAVGGYAGYRYITAPKRKLPGKG